MRNSIELLNNIIFGILYDLEASGDTSNPAMAILNELARLDIRSCRTGREQEGLNIVINRGFLQYFSRPRHPDDESNDVCTPSAFIAEALFEAGYRLPEPKRIPWQESAWPSAASRL